MVDLTRNHELPSDQPPGKQKVDKSRSCYNAFSRLDMRVHVTIPGTVEDYCIDERGDKRKASEELWLETYLCSVLRAYSYADDGNGETIRKIMGVRRFNPVTNTETEHRFLHAAEQLFFRGRPVEEGGLAAARVTPANSVSFPACQAGH